MANPRIAAIEWGCLAGQRPRNAGSNARLGEHGRAIRLPITRLTTSDGASGFGFSRAGPELAARLLGMPLSQAFSSATGVADEWRAFEFPLWDLAGCYAQLPVYCLAAAIAGVEPPQALLVPAYDTSLYFDDLHLASTSEAAELIAEEAREGYAAGHRAFKLKVGRGARHMPLTEGTERDIAIIRAVRTAVGPDCTLLIDANNGYNLNIAKHVLAETADCRIHWLEEAFHEDPVLYRDLKNWLAERDLPILIADGEGAASPDLIKWAHEGLIDVIQYDIFGYGLTLWLELGRQLDGRGIRSAPHHYGGHFGNYAACHLAAGLRNFAFVEWDEAKTPGLDTSAYAIQEGVAHVPNKPGFGLKLEEEVFQKAVAEGGGSLRL